MSITTCGSFAAGPDGVPQSGTRFVIGTEDGELEMYDAQSKSIIDHYMVGDGRPVVDVKVLAGDYMVVANQDPAVYVCHFDKLKDNPI